MSERKKTELGMTVSRRARIRLHTLGMTGADLVRATTMGSGQVSDYLNGYANMRIDKLVELADALDCSADFLLGRSADWRQSHDR